MSGVRRIILLNRSYWPEETATAQLLTDLAEGLASRGRSVTVIASQPPRRCRGLETKAGVTIRRVGRSAEAGAGLASKAANFLVYFMASLTALWRTARRGDAVVALTDPPLIGIGVAVVCGLKGAQLYHWVQDIYPEVAAQLSGRSSLNLLRGWRDGAWRRAAGCVTLGTDMAEVLRRGGVRSAQLQIWPNWAPAGLRPPAPADILRVRKDWGAAGKFVVGYSGNLGRVHDLDAIVDLAEHLKADDAIWIVLVGGGPQRRRIEVEAGRRGLRRIVFFPPAPRADLAASLAAADVQLVTLSPGCERWVFPSKLYGAAAVGRPVLFIGESRSEIAEIIRGAQMGGAFDRRDLAAAARRLRELQRSPAALETAGQNALRFASQTAGRDASVIAWDRWLFPPPNIDPVVRPNDSGSKAAR
jgi:colanic acid biosynthesis glycosyl transferase WcaI